MTGNAPITAMLSLDPGETHQAESGAEAEAHKDDRQEPVADVREEQAHDNDHQDHGGTDQDPHLGSHFRFHLGGERRIAGDLHRHARRGLGTVDKGLDIIEGGSLGVIRKTFNQRDLHEREDV